MPCLVLNTNVLKDDIPEKFMVEMSSLMAQLMGKPEKYLVLHINPSQMMAFGGTTDPCALVYVACDGKLGVEENKGHTTALMDKIHNNLKIKKDRIQINFTDMARGNVGWDGHTFA